MPSVIHKDVVDDGFELEIIEGAGRVWIRLKNGHSEAIEAFWSAEGSPSEVHWEEVVAILRARLAGYTAGKCSLDDVIEFWPNGWGFWGRGIPMPIADFVDQNES
jgi:hypothetical protein